MLRKNEKDGLIWYTFPLFDPFPELRHGVLTRFGGVSGPSGEDLALSFNEFDQPEKVRTNLCRAEAALGLPPAAFVRQTHGVNITVVRPGDNYRPQSHQESREDFDALLAPEPGVNLLVRVADCQAVIIYDPATRLLGLVHSGWRGSVQDILGLTTARMIEMGADPDRLLAAVGPSLGPCCAEFVNHRQELPEHFRDHMVRENYFDFWAISRRQLTARGLRPENIEIAGICTKCSSEFFSYRRGEWGRFGVMAAVMAGQ